jgi:hypothetical protein
VRAVQRQVDVVVAAGQPLQGQQLAADRGGPGDDPELEPSRATVAPTSAQRQQQHLGRLALLLGQDDRRSGEDDPGLLRGELGQRGAEQRHVVEPTGSTTAVPACTTLVASQAPPRPTSSTATSTGASANGPRTPSL